MELLSLDKSNYMNLLNYSIAPNNAEVVFHNYT